MRSRFCTHWAKQAPIPKLSHSMYQLSLDLFPPATPSFSQFAVGGNAEAFEKLLAMRGYLSERIKRLVQSQTWSAAASTHSHQEETSNTLLTSSLLEFSPRIVYLWGAQGSGKTYLLQAMYNEIGPPYAVAYRPKIPASHDPSTQGFSRQKPADRWTTWPKATTTAVQLLLVDDCHALHLQAQTDFFQSLNNLPKGAVVLAAGNQPPIALPLFEGLRSRLGSGLIFRLHPLPDEEKSALMQRIARGWGLELSRAVVDYLMTRSCRDISSLLAKLAALNRFALERKRAVTLPLLRKFTQNTEHL